MRSLVILLLFLSLLIPGNLAFAEKNLKTEVDLKKEQNAPDVFSKLEDVPDMTFKISFDSFKYKKAKSADIYLKPGKILISFNGPLFLGQQTQILALSKDRSVYFMLPVLQRAIRFEADKFPKYTKELNEFFILPTYGEQVMKDDNFKKIGEEEVEGETCYEMQKKIEGKELTVWVGKWTHFIRKADLTSSKGTTHITITDLVWGFPVSDDYFKIPSNMVVYDWKK
ncbi:hypothetical protein TDSAC_0879 [Thermodesulfobium acidiphilum]|uniref:Outer membrane lipoprotein-sorting protein n=1 Tax=Thermodesulfobium acidiphilum TaxID=1794699 RepID=A0A2R4W0J0_THEAF|nr:hypothetical protein [Thermodesulfobium acidiphilum]AWB10236.1 hypothetical protein TDSAC_0879 [Thermodesulfobium acidiphilum]